MIQVTINGETHKLESGKLTFNATTGETSIMVVDYAPIDRASSHDGKLQHKSLEDAEKAAKSFSEKKGQLFEGYKCRHCEFYHVGSAPSIY